MFKGSVGSLVAGNDAYDQCNVEIVGGGFVNNDARQRYGAIKQAIIGKSRSYGRVYLRANGHGIAYGDPARSTRFA